MKYEEPKIVITRFSVENIVTLSGEALKGVFEAYGQTGYTATKSVDVGAVIATNE